MNFNFKQNGNAYSSVIVVNQTKLHIYIHLYIYMNIYIQFKLNTNKTKGIKKT